jgi:hypothetical protein
VDALLLFKSGECLLLSEWEADQVLGLLWAHAPYAFHGPCRCLVSFVNLAYLRQAADEGWAQPQLLVGAPIALSPSPELVSPLLLSGLQLLAGETMFGTEGRRQAVRSLLHSPEARRAALRLPSMRGQKHMVPRSHLEAICAADIGHL